MTKECLFGIRHFCYEQTQNSAKAPNTIEAHLNAIKLLIEWSHSSNIVLEEIFSAKQFLTTEQIEHLCIYLKGKKMKKFMKALKVVGTKEKNCIELKFEVKNQFLAQLLI